MYPAEQELAEVDLEAALLDLGEAKALIPYGLADEVAPTAEADGARGVGFHDFEPSRVLGLLDAFGEGSW